MHTTSPQTTTVRTIPVDRIDPDPGQPRKHFDAAKLAELATTMADLGQLQTIAVRYDKSSRRYVIVAGERRWRAAQIAGITDLHCMVLHVDATDPKTLAKAMAENINREAMTPIEEANGFHNLCDVGYSVDEVARMCGKSAAFVTSRLDLLALVPAMQEAVMKGHIGAGLAQAVAALSPDNQHQFLTRHTRGQFLNGRDATAFAKRLAAAEREHAEQGGFFVMADPPAAPAGAKTAATARQLPVLDLPDVERDRIATDRGKLLRKIDKLGDAGATLSEIAGMHADELSILLDGAPGGIDATYRRLELLRTAAWKAMANLREARAAATVRANSLQIDPDLIQHGEAA
jgi:ParB family transcriptional regulator, chromosome partitioning protein